LLFVIRHSVLILALDTTTRAGSVAVVRAPDRHDADFASRGGDDQVLALLPGDESRTHGERLPREIAEALDRARVSRDQIDLLAVAAGPGGFTGLRIGLAAMQGLAMTLNRPVAGVSALRALAAQVSDASASYVAPWMDAQRGDVFASLIDAKTAEEVDAPVAEHPSKVLTRWQSRLSGRRVVFIGDAVRRDADAIAAVGGGQWRIQEPGPLAPQVALLGKRLAEQGLAGPPHALVPMYIRRPDAEIERGRGRPNDDPEPNPASERGRP
jgi:tRNA threonylcarbamoyladenosine biosynthesis protein TsaB